jgi:hypothetical protein
MDGETASAIAPGNAVLITRPRHRRKAATHDPEGLPEQSEEAGCVNERQQLGE